MEILPTLLYYSDLFQSAPAPSYKRAIYKNISFNHKLIGLRGAKGVGKTTILQQHLKESDLDISEKVYISLDNPLLGGERLLHIAETLQKRGVKLLVVDEIHYQRDFEKDLKTIYDFFDMKVIFSGSSAIALSGADLSRRALVYDVPILSFREFLELKLDIDLKPITYERLLSHHVQEAFKIIPTLKPLRYFDEYVKFGAYPFFLEGDEKDYVMKLTMAVNKTLESDLLQLFNIDPQNVSLLKKLLTILCQSAPGRLNMSSLSREMRINVKTLYNYITALQKGSLIRLLYYNKKGNALFQKPDKILLHNPSLFNILCHPSNKGSMRESFFVSMLEGHTLRYAKRGDYTVDGKDSFEIGGKNKGFKQIQDTPNSYVVADDIEIGDGNKIPLWLFGFLY